VIAIGASAIANEMHNCMPLRNSQKQQLHLFVMLLSNASVVSLLSITSGMQKSGCVLVTAKSMALCASNMHYTSLALQPRICKENNF
jgi:hypothetical protein